LESVLVTSTNLPRKVDLLGPLEQRIRADLIEVLIEDISLRFTGSDSRGSRTAATTL